MTRSKYWPRCQDAKGQGNRHLLTLCEAPAVAVVPTDPPMFVCGNHARRFLKVIPLGKLIVRKSIARNQRGQLTAAQQTRAKQITQMFDNIPDEIRMKEIHNLD